MGPGSQSSWLRRGDPGFQAGKDTPLPPFTQSYTLAYYGRDLVVIDRWYPSSKTCAACGHVAASLPLNIREWDCPSCGTRHDRDVNAARNILVAGLAVSACGGGVRPKPVSRGGRSPAKQETQRVTAGIPCL